MAYTNPTVAQFQAQFVRDFPYGTDPKTSILDSDISYAFQMVNMNINQGLFTDQGTYTMAYNLLAAHYMCMNIQASSQGFQGQYNFLQNNKNVGNVSESFSIPERILENPTFSMLAKTTYGAQYLQLLLPQLIGQVMSFCAPAKAL